MKKSTIRAAVAALAATVLVSGCATVSSRDRATMTPQEIAMREQADTFNQTVGEGVLLGCLAGGGVGAVATASQNQNPLLGAAVGCLAGGAAGGFAGWYIADKQEKYASEEKRLDAMIVDVRNDNQQLSSLIQSSRSVIAADRAKIDSLENQLAAGKISKAQARQELAAIDDNTEYLNSTLKSLQDRRDGYMKARQETNGTPDQLAAMDAEIATLEAQISGLKSDVDGLVQRRTVSRIG